LDRHGASAPVCDAAGPAGSLIPAFEARGIEVLPVKASELARACGLFFDAVEQKQLRHVAQSELQTALRGAARQPSSDAWKWSRKTSAVDICPLVAVTLAHWGHLSQVGKPDPEPMVAFA